jgi:hypothetical protein
MTLDVFLTSFRSGEEVPVDSDALDAALAANGLAGDRGGVRTADGGAADLLVDTDGASFLIARLTPDVSRLLFDVAEAARLVVLPADGTPNAYVVDEGLAAELPEDLTLHVVTTSASLNAALEASAEARGARTA